MSRKKIPHGLADVASREIGSELDKHPQTADWGGELSPEMLDYAAANTRVLPPLSEALGARVREAGLERALEIESRAVPAVAWMAGAGVPFDAEGWREHLATLEKERESAEAKLCEVASGKLSGGG